MSAFWRCCPWSGLNRGTGSLTLGGVRWARGNDGLKRLESLIDMIIDWCWSMFELFCMFFNVKSWISSCKQFTLASASQYQFWFLATLDAVGPRAVPRRRLRVLLSVRIFLECKWMVDDKSKWHANDTHLEMMVSLEVNQWGTLPSRWRSAPDGLMFCNVSNSCLSYCKV